MSRSAFIVVLALAATPSVSIDTAQAFTTPFHFHCRGNACRAVSFLDEGNGCTVATNYGRQNVHVTQGPFYYDLGPGETHAELLNSRCAGYYDGGETATFE